ncbi:hypothetical protein [Citricoccus sp.]|uniref:hypothetical protein n=1 Tax=Citricoccus sp. TaxID=1978372 RepID=UPI002612DF1D|nr:hypothetical protein [Citricoccus sp.]HRO29454.1 hypothetical protein [Citricoccus sp.]HRO93073.1 hypothetical protein [Citricoccus sp.]
MMGYGTERGGDQDDDRGVPGESAASRCWRRTPVALGLAAVLALASCAAVPGGGNSSEATGPSESAAVQSTEAAGATESGDVTGSVAASPTPTASGAPGDGEGAEDGDGSTQTHSTEGGHFRWTLPADWTISEELAGPDTTEAYGVKNERWVFQNPEGTAVFSANTGVGPTDGDGAKPDVVEVVDAERLRGLPADPEYGEEDTWYRAAILRDNGLRGDEGFFDGEEYRLAVQVVGVPQDVDPEAPGDDYWSGWTFVLPAAPGTGQGTASFLQGRIAQSDAEAITGREGKDALRAVLETEEYSELRDVATSLQVTAP